MNQTARALAEIAAEQATQRASQLAVERANTNPRWHILQCVGHADSYVLEWLGRSKFETYYPLIRELRPIPRRQLSQSQRKLGLEVLRPKNTPLFPRYMFVRFDVGSNGWRDVFEFAGVGGLVCMNGEPAPVSDLLIASLRQREVNGAVPGKASTKLVFALGDEVKVVEGPFSAFHGKLQKVLDMPIEEVDVDTRIKVLMNIFGRLTPVDLHPNQVVKL